MDDCDYHEQQQIWKGIQKISRRVHTRVLFAGRDDIKISGFLPGQVLRLKLDWDFVPQDIGTYVETRLLEQSGPDQLLNNERLRERVKNELLARAGGM